MKNLMPIALVFGITLGLWFILALCYPHPILPPPGAVLVNLVTQLHQGLVVHTGYSLLRVGAATLLALAWGVPLGILIGLSKGWNRLLSPFIYFSYPIPKLALLPLLMLFFGLGETPKIFMIFLIIFFPIVMDISNGVKSIDREIFEVLRSYGISQRQIALQVVVPGILPQILNSLKITTGIALSVLFFAENYGTTRGLGFYITNSWQKMDYLNLYTGVLALSLLGFCLFCLFDYLERKVTSWR